MKKAILLFALIITMSAFSIKNEAAFVPDCSNWLPVPGNPTHFTRTCVSNAGSASSVCFQEATYVNGQLQSLTVTCTCVLC